MPDAETLANLEQDLPAVQEFAAANDGSVHADAGLAALYWYRHRV